MYIVKHPDLEAALREVMARPDFPKIVVKYDEMLGKLGNVDGDEIIALAVIAFEATKTE